MGFDDIEKILEAMKTNPSQTFVIVCIIVVVAMATFFLKNYLSEKGKKAASGKRGGEKQPDSGVHIGDIKTHNQSPVIVGDNPTITYGVPQSVVDRLLKTIEEKDFAIEDREAKLQELTQRYKELDERLAKRPPDDEFAAQAKLKLDQGDLESAEKLLLQSLGSIATPEPKENNRVFLSYAHENLEMVLDIYSGLKKRGLDVWFDKEDLGPGLWKRKIEKAIPKCRYFVICISQAALKKTGDKTPGFQDDELQQAYEIARVQPEDAFTIVPVRLEECGRGDHRLSPYQQYDLFNDFETKLDHLAVNLGGKSLSDSSAKDTRTEDDKLYDSLHGKATTFFFANDHENALVFIEAAANLRPDSTATLLAKGILLLSLGNEEEANAVFSKIEKMDPKYFTDMIEGANLNTFNES
jgi:tetratricopeptide (TPR) repeat protein